MPFYRSTERRKFEVEVLRSITSQHRKMKFGYSRGRVLFGRHRTIGGNQQVNHNTCVVCENTSLARGGTHDQ
jgi:hypothetical protein